MIDEGTSVGNATPVVLGGIRKAAELEPGMGASKLHTFKVSASVPASKVLSWPLEVMDDDEDI